MNDYRAFISERSLPIPGDIVDVEGNALGTHQGIEYFTVGQRRGLGINSEKPMFVLSLNRELNQVVVGTADGLLQSTLWTSAVNYLSGTPPEQPIEIEAKIRYKSSQSSATLTPHGQWAQLRFYEPQRAITPGQAVVFYRDDEVLGGGIIEGVLSSDAIRI